MQAVPAPALAGRCPPTQGRLSLLWFHFSPKQPRAGQWGPDGDGGRGAALMCLFLVGMCVESLFSLD